MNKIIGVKAFDLIDGKYIKCRNFTFEEGGTYTTSKLEICEYGFHYCKDIKFLNDYNYNIYNKDVVIHEVEILGSEIADDNCKFATNKIKIGKRIEKDFVEYDSNGNKIKKTYPNGNVYTYKYDSNGNMTKETYPNGDVYTWEYDSNGNIIFSNIKECVTQKSTE